MPFSSIFLELLGTRVTTSTIARALSVMLICCPYVSGCFNPAAPAQVAQPAGSDVTNLIAGAGDRDRDAGCASTGPLRELWQQRSRENNSSDYPVGPGDILQITAADLPEINKLNVRVNGQGEIALPLLGELNVAGLTEEDAAQLIAQKARVFIRHPRVHVFTQHFAGRNVSVMGMVALPGTYALNSPAESILSILGRAGGLKGTGDEPAAQRVVLFPAGTGVRQSASDAEAAAPESCALNRTGIPNGGVDAISGDQATNFEDPSSNHTGGGNDLCAAPHPMPQIAQAKIGDPAPPPGEIGASVMPIIIDMAKPSMASCLNLPARPGDIILVPAAGQVGVYGWVARPGQFNITPGMTVLGAITGAGGAMFSSTVELLRTSHGERISTRIDLSRVEKGQEPDFAVQGGDVVLVKSSAVGAIPYGVYTLFNKFGTGMYVAPGL